MTRDFASASGLDIILPARNTTADQMLDYAANAEGAGWGGVWLAEVLSLDATVLIGALAQRLKRARIATSIVPMTTRSTALLGMFAATASALIPGRFALGLGTSTPGIVTDRHNRPVRRPAELARATLQVLDTVLSGGHVESNEELAIHNLKLGPVDERPPLFLAALGPQMLATAAAVADGQLLNLVPHDDAVQKSDTAKRTAGASFITYLSQRVCIEPTGEDLATIRREIASYSAVPVYRRNFERLGFDLTGVVPEALGVPAVVPDELIHALVITGTPSECRERLNKLRADGVRPIVVPSGTRDSTERVISRLDPNA